MTEGIAFTPVAYRQKRSDAWEERKGGSYRLLFKISLQCKDPNDQPYGNMIVALFLTSNNLLVDSVVSDAAGYALLYTPYITNDHYCIAYSLSGNVAGMTVNTLVPEE
jgi:hypothetical protein